MVLCGLKYIKKIDLMLSVPTKEKKKEHKEMSGSNGYI